ncbi:MAG: glycosyltransferase family 4 protein [Ginsengibacter sp.]
MKKVAFYINSPGWGGLEMNTIKLALLCSKENEIVFIATEGSRTQAEAATVFEKIITLPRPGRYFDLNGAYGMASILKSNNVRNVFITNNRDIQLLSLVKRFFYKSVKIIYQQQMQIGVNKKDMIHTLRYSSLCAWISPLKYLKDQVLEKTNVPLEKIKVIPLAIDVNYFSSKKYTRQQAFDKLKLPHFSEPLIGIIGRIDPQKGQLFVIKALNELNKKKKKIHLLIFGSPTINEKGGEDYLAEMKEYVAQHKLKNFVHFIPYSKDVKLFYDAVDVFAMASINEAFGMVTLEAMASGVLVIGSNVAGTPEILNNGEFGLVYKLNNVEDFCEKVEWSLSHQDEKKAMTARAIEEVKKYDQKKIAEKIIELF